MNLFVSSFFPIVIAQLSLNFDVDKQRVNFLSLDTALSENVQQVFTKFFTRINQLLFLCGNHVMYAVHNIEEFGMVCALIFLDIENSSLENVQIVKLLRDRYEKTLYDYAVAKMVPFESRVTKFYNTIECLKMAKQVFQQIFFAIQSEEFLQPTNCTPLFNDLRSRLMAMAKYNNENEN